MTFFLYMRRASLNLQYSPKVLGRFANFKSSHNIHPPFPPTQCWFLGEVHAVTEKFFFTITPCISGTDHHCFGGTGGAWKLQYLKCYERYSFLQIFESVPGTFGEYCRYAPNFRPHCKLVDLSMDATWVRPRLN